MKYLFLLFIPLLLIFVFSLVKAGVRADDQADMIQSMMEKLK